MATTQTESRRTGAKRIGALLATVVLAIFVSFPKTCIAQTGEPTEGVQGDGSKLLYGEMLSWVREFDGVLYTLWLNTEYEALNPLDTQPEAFDMGYDLSHIHT